MLFRTPLSTYTLQLSFQHAALAPWQIMFLLPLSCRQGHVVLRSAPILGRRMKPRSSRIRQPSPCHRPKASISATRCYPSGLPRGWSSTPPAEILGVKKCPPRVLQTGDWLCLVTSTFWVSGRVVKNQTCCWFSCRKQGVCTLLHHWWIFEPKLCKPVWKLALSQAMACCCAQINKRCQNGKHTESMAFARQIGAFGVCVFHKSSEWIELL